MYDLLEVCTLVFLFLFLLACPPYVYETVRIKVSWHEWQMENK